MKLLKVTLLFFLSFKLLASDVQIFELSANGQKVNIPFYTTEDKVLINDVCNKSKSKCKALQAYKKPILQKVEQKNLSSEAAAYCKLVHGVPLFLRSEAKASVSFCAFKDDSIISSWDLYESYHQKKKNKLKIKN